MKAMQSFLIFFYILDQIYDQCKENDLGAFLGTISPEVWTDGKPIDNAVYIDWQKKSNPETCKEENIVKRTYAFLNYYEQTFKYDFSKTKKGLVELSDKDIVKNANNKALQMYQRFNYID